LKEQSRIPKISICMAVYNGAPFLQEQLESIIAQTYTNWELLIRDDGSTDSGMDILTYYASRDPRIRIIIDGKGQLGVCQNFNELLGYHDNSDYFMFADQDDRWLPTKIERSLQAMETIEKNTPSTTPILVHSKVRYTDETMVPLSKKYYCYSGSDTTTRSYGLLIHNWIFGCTMLFNKALLDCVFPIPQSDYVTVHDAWIAQLASLCGIVHVLDSHELLHRLHANNATDSRKTISFIAKISVALKKIRSSTALIMIKYNQCLLLKERLSQCPSCTTISVIDSFMTLLQKRNVTALLWGVRHNIHATRPFHTLVFYLQLFTGKKSK